mmetsp:Transcript_11613/g.22633  ORF Transcript_11613/g.22633 Transcript_11613/m.22633 type:complete len:130 (+) Transcript_11613:73-462(+)
MTKAQVLNLLSTELGLSEADITMLYRLRKGGMSIKEISEGYKVPVLKLKKFLPKALVSEEVKAEIIRLSKSGQPSGAISKSFKLKKAIIVSVLNAEGMEDQRAPRKRVKKEETKKADEETSGSSKGQLQ